MAIDVRAPEPGEGLEAYKAYAAVLFAPIGAEVRRLRAELAAARVPHCPGCGSVLYDGSSCPDCGHHPSQQEEP